MYSNYFPDYRFCTEIIDYEYLYCDWKKKTGEKINEMIQGVKKKFGLDAKDIYTVTDAGSNVKRAVSLGNMEHHLCLGLCHET